MKGKPVLFSVFRSHNCGPYALILIRARAEALRIELVHQTIPLVLAVLKLLMFYCMQLAAVVANSLKNSPNHTSNAAEFVRRRQPASK